jgi:oligopeptide/dipeptide ABC transporter ATP-binding protein
MPLLETENLNVTFRLPGGRRLAAVTDVTLHVEPGEIVGLVGESGCGKSTLGLAALGLIQTQGGRVRFQGRDVAALRGADLQAFRRQAQMIFQDPYGSLNPRLTVGAAIEEALKVHRLGARAVRRGRVRELLELVGLSPDYAGRYPHEFSGGQRQRVGIARALALSPALVVADEPVSALDVSVQVQILNLMKDLQERLNLAYLFVAHDLAVVRYLCRRVYVMYLGRIVEEAPADALFSRPAHPYTQALLAVVPDVDKGLRQRQAQTKRAVLAGEIPSAFQTLPGCPFHPRCPNVRDRCRMERPDLRPLSGGQAAACHFART